MRGAKVSRGFLCTKKKSMLIFKSKKEDGSYFELNYCEDGIYVEMSDGSEVINYIIPHSHIFDLMEYLKTQG